MQPIHHAAFVFSVIVFAIETLVFVNLKKRIDESPHNFATIKDEAVEEMFLVLRDVEPEQLLIYAGLYLLGLLVAYFVHFALICLLFIQMISIGSELWLLRTLKLLERGTPNKTSLD